MTVPLTEAKISNDCDCERFGLKIFWLLLIFLLSKNQTRMPYSFSNRSDAELSIIREMSEASLSSIVSNDECFKYNQHSEGSFQKIENFFLKNQLTDVVLLAGKYLPTKPHQNNMIINAISTVATVVIRFYYKSQLLQCREVRLSKFKMV